MASLLTTASWPPTLESWKLALESLFLNIITDGHLLVETLLVVVIVALLLQKSYQPQKRPLSEAEIDQLCEEWEPEPLHPPLTEIMKTFKEPVLESAAGPHTVVNGKDVINLTSFNFLGLIGNEEMQRVSRAAIEKYGVGACGPRGFYGTIDVHVEFEERVARFMGTEDCILYSYGLATAPSTIPAFCKRGDIIICDEAAHWGIQNGIHLSRSTVAWFKHNDMDDLEAKLKAVKEEDVRKKRRKVVNRRFIIVEAICQNTGFVTPMDKIMELKKKYHFRVIVDESLSLGVMGKTGRGCTEHFNIPVQDVDMIIAGMGFAFASIGGFCCGSHKVVDHQRLMGAGYCFSAALPPYLASNAIAAIDQLEMYPSLLTKLQDNVRLLRKALQDTPGMVVGSNENSPVIHMYLKNSTNSFGGDFMVLQKIVEKMLDDKSVLLTCTKRMPLDRVRWPASIRIAVSAGHNDKDLLAAAESLKVVAASVLES
ncbi:hypothetical protein CBR_g21746 [Chara braunii]|uniref:serine C-palmitoyltransferase n=1 Tax=Chara braunii TaxID=69332 RepID=A0A388L185_CHABU|nr:hypothetical protein CBR_g21746 [Chara braunii]|eukprot:GBG76086.1 hypothetical protein CBR_g21746 [Chara braunii]